MLKVKRNTTLSSLAGEIDGIARCISVYTETDSGMLHDYSKQSINKMLADLMEISDTILQIQIKLSHANLSSHAIITDEDKVVEFPVR